jgi:hypothetical protein
VPYTQVIIQLPGPPRGILNIPEEVRAAKLSWDKFFYEAAAKKPANAPP